MGLYGNVAVEVDTDCDGVAASCSTKLHSSTLIDPYLLAEVLGLELLSTFGGGLMLIPLVWGISCAAVSWLKNRAYDDRKI